MTSRNVLLLRFRVSLQRDRLFVVVFGTATRNNLQYS